MKAKKLNILDDVYYYHPEHGWKLSFVVSNSLPNKIIVAGYGPALPAQHVLLDTDYANLKANGELLDYSNKIIQSPKK